MSKELFIKVGLKLPEDSEEEFTQEEIDQMTLDYVKEFNRCPEIEYDINISFEDIEKKQLEELKAENERLKNKPTYDYEAYEKDLEEAIRIYQQQLKEKDEEIEKYQKDINDICNKFMVCSLNEIYKKYIDMCNEVVRLTETNSKLCKANTHQVCEKIRKELIYAGRTYLEDEPYIELCIVNGILDKIEKGDK